MGLRDGVWIGMKVSYKLFTFLKFFFYFYSAFPSVRETEHCPLNQATISSTSQRAKKHDLIICELIELSGTLTFELKHEYLATDPAEWSLTD